jgi:tetratricopeptide (TPR) repeat protein
MALGDRDPLRRRAAAEQLESIDPALRAPMGLPLLDDSVRTERLAVLPALAGLSDSGWTAAQRTAFGRVLAEYRASQEFNADRPESWVNLGSLDARLGRTDVAETEYRHAITLQPQFVPAYMQLAELYRTAQQEQQADSVLRMGLDRAPGNADLQYQLGLALVRQGKKADALPYLKAAAASRNSHYVYVYAVGLYDAGQTGPSIKTLQGALVESPDDTELLYGLASIAAAAGQRDVALPAARRLATLEPGNQNIQRFLAQLEGGAPPRQ